MDFYRMFAAYYNTIFPFAEGKEIFFNSLVQKYRPKTAIDLGCATGELTAFLNNNGCETIGVDLSPDLLRLTQGKPGEFILADMVDYLANPPVQKKDLVVCIGNTLPHVEPSNVQKMISEIPNWLGKDGLLVIQTVNYQRILDNRPPGLSTIDRPEAGVKFTRLYDYKTNGSIAFTAVLDSPQGQNRATVTLWPYTSGQFKEMLPSSFSVEAEYGGFTDSPFSPAESTAWVLVAKHN
jgi:SAM-dependent methyltransferase